MAHRRATERDRERAAAQLRRGWVDGAVSTDTFDKRLGLALTAGSQEELRAVTDDLPQREHPLRRALERLVSRPAAGAPPLVLRIPADEQQVVLGRHRSCSRVYDDDSVSRRHAVLRRCDAGMRLYDLDATNGTWLNGARVERAAEVVTGDEIRLGRVQLVVRLD